MGAPSTASGPELAPAPRDDAPGSGYATWRRAHTLGNTRNGMATSIANWLVTVLLSGIVFPQHLVFTATVAALVPLPLILFTLWCTSRPERHSWLLALTAIANSAAGLSGLVLIRTWLLGAWAEAEATAIMGVTILVGSFAFTIFRLPPMAAVLAVLPYATGAQALLVLETGSTPVLILTTSLMWMAFVSGLYASVVNERLLRERFVLDLRLQREKQASEFERHRADTLLLNVLPASIAARLKASPAVIAERFDDVTVLFADLVGFTTLAAQLPPEAVVALLARVFSAFDELASRLQVEKIKTIGDAYMVVAGAPVPREDHAQVLASLALELNRTLSAINAETGHALSLRIGLASGPVVAGVIGTRKLAFDLWGDTVNTAARMESHGLAGKIQVASTTRLLLGDRFTLEERGVIEVKGKGPMPTWWLLGER